MDVGSWWRDRKQAVLQRRKEAALDASWANLRKAFASLRYHKPRPWRSPEEMLMIRRFALWLWTCRDRNRPPIRAWARKLDVSHVWLLKLFRKFETDPVEVRRLQRMGDPTSTELDRARDCTRRMRERGELRSPARKAPAIERAMERFVKERHAQGWSKSRLARELFLDPRIVKRILQKSLATQNTGRNGAAEIYE